MNFVIGAGARSLSPKRVFGAAGVVMLLALTGCGGGDGTDNDAAGTSTTAGKDRVAATTVVLKNVKFAPADITVSKGATVTWQWDDGTVPHDVAFDDFKSDVQEQGTFEHTFDDTGVFEFKCTVHPTMTGSVEVTE